MTNKPTLRFARRGHTAGSLVVAGVLVFGCYLIADPGVASDTTDQLPVRGMIRSSNQAAISTDLITPVIEIGFKEGESFHKGDLLVAFDCREQRAKLASAEAQHQEMSVVLKSATFLAKHNAGSQQSTDTARARVARAAAEAEVIRAELSKCHIVAPFDGRVAELWIHKYETPVAGKPIVSIVSDIEPEIELIVPSAWLTWLKAGTEFQFNIDETGSQHIAKITRLGAAVDTVSQTIKVFAKFKDLAPDVLSGMSGTANFELLEGELPGIVCLRS